MNSIDPITLQRLVDGELDLPQVQQLIKEIDVSPDQWRDIATAMIEDRLWQQAVRVQDPANGVSSDGDLAAAMLSAIETNPVTLWDDENRPARENMSYDSQTRDHSANSLSQKSKSPTTQAPPARTNWMLIAASLFVAVGFGYVVGGPLNFGNSNAGLALTENEALTPPTGSADFIAENSASNRSSIDDPTLANGRIPPHRVDPNQSKITPAVYQPDYHLQVPDDNQLLSTENVGPVDPVPLFAVRNADQLRRFQQQQRDHWKLSTELMQRMSDRGFRMQQDIEFITGKVNDDHSFVVPIRTIRFVPRQ